MNLPQLAAAVAPVVLLVTLGVRAALWQARTSQRLADAERRLAEHGQALHRIGAALRHDD